MRRALCVRSPAAAESLPEALDALERDPVFRKQLGDVFIDYLLRLKRNEAGRFAQWSAEHDVTGKGDDPTDWEQREYFDFF